MCFELHTWSTVLNKAVRAVCVKWFKLKLKQLGTSVLYFLVWGVHGMVIVLRCRRSFEQNEMLQLVGGQAVDQF